MKLLFNRNPIVVGMSIEQPGEELVRNTLGLHKCSLEDAVKYGGELTRAALSVMDLRGDRKHVVVDTKVHMLMPGFTPAIPGWHTDGVPRGPNRDSVSRGAPDIFSQDDGTIRPHRYHLLVTGVGCLPEFVMAPLELDVSNDDLYAGMSRDVKALGDTVHTAPIPTCTAVSWDWWNIHRGITATRREWRFLIRVMETDMCEPIRDLRDIIRTQQQVYTPMEFGW